MTLPAPVVEEHGGVMVVRDDLLPGGTKMRAILPLIERKPPGEFVYPSPAYGYAQVALAHCARMAGRAATVFTAKRASPHPLTRAAHDAGAKVVMVPYGYLSNVRAKARAYADATGAALVPFGVEDDRAMEAIAEAARSAGLALHRPARPAGRAVLERGAVAVAYQAASSNGHRSRRAAMPAARTTAGFFPICAMKLGCAMASFASRIAFRCSPRRGNRAAKEMAFSHSPASMSARSWLSLVTGFMASYPRVGLRCG